MSKLPRQQGNHVPYFVAKPKGIKKLTMSNNVNKEMIESNHKLHICEKKKKPL